MGLFFNDEIKITVKVEDQGSGIHSIKLLTSDEKVIPQLIEGESNIPNGLAVFTLDDESFSGTFKVEVTDLVSNVGTYEVDQTNSNITSANNEIKFDKKAPVIGTEPHYDINIDAGEGIVFYEGNGEKHYYSDNVTFEAVITDPDSGINKVVNKINGVTVDSDDFSKGEEALSCS